MTTTDDYFTVEILCQLLNDREKEELMDMLEGKLVQSEPPEEIVNHDIRRIVEIIQGTRR